MPTLSKSNLVERIRRSTCLNQVEAKLAVNAIVDLIKRALRQDGRLLVTGFGVFHVTAKKARPARNPGTGEVVMLPPYRAVTFSISRKLRDVLNQDVHARDDEFPPIEEQDMLASGRPGMILRAHRQQRGMTQMQLANAVGVVQRRISEIENGTRPIGEDLARSLAEALGTDWNLYVTGG